LVNQNYYSYCCISDYLFLSRESVTVTKNVFFFRDKLRRLKLTRSLCQPTHIYPFILHIICANLSNLYPPFRWHSGSVRGRIHPHRTAAASEGPPLRHSLLYIVALVIAENRFCWKITHSKWTIFENVAEILQQSCTPRVGPKFWGSKKFKHTVARGGLAMISASSRCLFASKLEHLFVPICLIVLLD
jgi:hypothetical protein